MNNQCTAVSSTDLTIHLSKSPSTRCQLSHDRRLNAAIFERLLHFLGPDSHTACRKYESIRAQLIGMFRARRCVFAEDLADTTFERVADRLADLTSKFTGDPAPYFRAVAKKIYLEYLRKFKANKLKATCWQPTSIDNPDSENMLEQLDKALAMIPNADRELILRYYAWDERNKIDHRRELANQLGIGLNALRLRVFRIRKEIKKNMLQLDADS